MAGLTTAEFVLMDQLMQDGWFVVDMVEYEYKIFDVVKWCRQTLGPMLTMYVSDIIDCRWHGSTMEMNGKHYTIFAFKDPADYTMLKLRWS